MSRMIVVFAVGAIAWSVSAQKQDRPLPRVIDPGTVSSQDADGKPPSDAIVLFDGKDLETEWVRQGKQGDEAKPMWKVEKGYAEVTPRSGHIVSRKKFGDAQIHIEWATPEEVKGNGQGRGNSGVKLGGFREVQILDSYENNTYPHGQAAALYGRSPPMVNASRKPGEWQTFDIITQLPKTNEEGKVVKPGLITVLHNGIVVHHAVEFGRAFGEYDILLQNHGNPVRFRNIWVRKLDEEPDKK